MKKFAIFFDRAFNDRQWFIILGLAAIALWTINLGNLPLRDWDEGSHAIVARELYRQGNWLYLTFFGQPYFLKPPLGYWIIASSYHLFGSFNEWTTRLPVALISALGVPLLYLVGRELFPNRRTALYAASVYLTLLPVVRHGRLMMLDGIINTFFILLLFCLLRSRKSPPWALGMGICLALIALTKGVLVFALWAVAGAYILVDRQWKILKNPYTWLGVLLGCAMTLSWYYAQWFKYGDLFIQIHLGTQNFNRLTTAVEGNDGSIFYYLIELLKYSFPWFLFLPGGLYLAVKSARNRETWGNFVLVGTILFLGTISFMGTKLPWYVMPFYPFFALAVGAQIAKLPKKRAYPRFLNRFFLLMVLVGIGGGIYFILADPQWVLILMSGVIIVTMGWMVRKPSIPILFLGMYLSLGLLMLSQSWIWELNEQFPVPKVGELIRKHTPPTTEIYTSFPYNRPSLDFYSDRAVHPADLQSLQQHFANQKYLLLDAATLETLQIPESTRVGTAEGFTLIKPSQ
ncbi:glycosyltransferase family 39 protein [Lusitaniella coriacea LEGE 07157]|uniref:Glycosyltransferase family 39 protein n=1 Tax=Lusitaniella coriacea LEGE 07157 TaxID=945747 RepID=A0A8J7ASD3_9CYAN|nr:glycosyltransferase family 39 protein [Lusitaniella coriacea]MBE9115466.1 glycosyltransferase family 39 protein [Lusitaniella coriacea LEGE 07157]